MVDASDSRGDSELLERARVGAARRSGCSTAATSMRYWRISRSPSRQPRGGCGLDRRDVRGGTASNPAISLRTEAPAVAWLFAIAHNKLTDSVRRGMVENASRRRLGMESLALDDDDLLRVVELIRRESRAPRRSWSACLRISETPCARGSSTSATTTTSPTSCAAHHRSCANASAADYVRSKPSWSNPHERLR